MWHAWERGETCTGFVWKRQKEKSLGKPRRRWENGMKMVLREIV
jgi:hypothetical protein